MEERRNLYNSVKYEKYTIGATTLLTVHLGMFSDHNLIGKFVSNDILRWLFINIYSHVYFALGAGIL